MTRCRVPLALAAMGVKASAETLREELAAFYAGGSVVRVAAASTPDEMLLRASNGVGYTHYPDNVVRYFVQESAKGGMDLFRIFDSLNWVDNMRVAIDSVLESGALCEGAICYTADLFDRARFKYDLRYYLDIGRRLRDAGVHVIGIKDMAGVCRPRAASACCRARWC